MGVARVVAVGCGTLLLLAGLVTGCSRSPTEAPSEGSSTPPAAATATATSTTDRTAVPLRLHFRRGRRWRASAETKLVKRGATALIRHTDTLHEVLDVDSQGAATIRVVDEWLRTELPRDAGVEVRDTRRAPSLRGAPFEWLRRAASIAEPVVLRVSPRGVVQAVVSSPAEAALGQSLEQLMAAAGAGPPTESQQQSMRTLAATMAQPEAYWTRWPELPKQPLPVGGSWRQHVDAPSLQGSRVEHRIRYTLERIAARRAHVIYAAKTRWLPGDSLAETLGDPQLELTGHFSLDVAGGMLLESTRTMRGELTVPDTAVVPGGGELQATIVTTTRYELVPSPPER